MSGLLYPLRLLAMIAVAAAMLTGCASVPNQRDPIEGVNRVVFALNDGLDTLAIRPVAVAYDFVLPQPVKQGVSNFFGNIEDLFVGVNNILQGKPGDGVKDFGRVLVNSTVGVLGFVDVASTLGLEKHEEDFGQTFGSWGIGSGPYAVVPIFGPRSLRDAVGLVVDSSLDPTRQLDDVGARNSLSVLRLVNRRAQLLPADKVIAEAALDRYAYVRDAYLQRRLNLVYDGNAPRRSYDDE